MSVSGEAIDTSRWGYWEWNGLRKVVVNKDVDQHMKSLGFITVEYDRWERRYTYIAADGSEKTGKSSGATARLTWVDPRLEALWRNHIGTVNNCGFECRNIQLKVTPDGRCHTCGATFDADGNPSRVCQGCGVEAETLHGHIMGSPDFCKKCDDAKRASSGGPCRMCGKKYWDCCC